ncbi:hypothetical protein P3G55_08850 [Leptospira sp. 96542]|nr:hypothetical protein [Leptospira sp. 96542]
MNINTIKLSGVFGFSTLVLSLVGLFLYPNKAELSEGFRTPIIAFEFASSEEDLNFLTGNSEAAKNARRTMKNGQNLDMIFPFVYAGFILFLVLSTNNPYTLLRLLGIIISVLIVPFDLYENYILDLILNCLNDSKSITELLPTLKIATWLKWGSISFVLATLSISHIRNKQLLSALISSIVSLSIFSTAIANGNGFVAETMMIFVSVFFVYFGIRSLVLYYKSRPT